MKNARLHFMGIGGQGISAVAQMARLAGHSVTGCDRQASATTRALEKAGVWVQIGHSAAHLENVDMLVISPAVPSLDPENPELVAARARGIPILPWQELLGELMRGKCLLSVSGVHGKGTTTAMLALILVDAGLDPTCEIGAVVPRFGTNYRLGTSEYFINEADEFNHNFWHYHPRLVVVTSIEFEHPEFFANYTAFLDAFEHFIRGMDMSGNWPLPPTLILNADSPGCMHLLHRLKDWPGRVVTYALSPKERDAVSKEKTQATFEAYDVNVAGQTCFRVRSSWPGAFPTDAVIQLQLPGEHNIQNALAAFTAATVVGTLSGGQVMDAETIRKTLADFSGIRRRFEIRHHGPLAINGQTLDILWVDDYAHHPTAIAATLEAARQRYPHRRLVAVYQPHMFSRTKTFFEQFLTAFDEADVTIIADIFPARERDTGLISASDLVEAMQNRLASVKNGKQIIHGGDVQATAQVLSSLLRSNDLVLVMGAGDIYTLTDMVIGDGEPPSKVGFWEVGEDA